MNRWIAIATAAATVLACMGRSEDSAPSETAGASEPAPATPEAVEAPMKKEAERMEEEAAADEAVPADLDDAFGKGEDAPPSPDIQGAPGGSARGGEAATPTRSWFPETLLFEPLVVTDETGTARVEMRVPDRLTTWRLLALAHSRDGAQAGAVARFAGTLAVYIDPVVPDELRVGDEVAIPIQLVNTTDEPITTTANVEIDGDRGELVGGGRTPVVVPPRSSALRMVTVRARRPGRLRLLASLGNSDAVVKPIRIEPTGRPVVSERRGTLAEPRSFELSSRGDDETRARVRLVVSPGPLAVLRSELASAVDRGGVADDAFGLLLAGRAPAMFRALGEEPDAKQLRALSVVLTQRVIRHARVLDITTAAVLAEATAAHPDNPILARIAGRAVDTLRGQQRPDGTCAGQDGWTLQRLLVATADCARAAPGERDVVIRANGAFERHADAIRDPYTAAAILAGHGASGELEERLRASVLAAVEQRPDGARVLRVPDGVQRADGARPSEMEATALAVLALGGHAPAPSSPAPGRPALLPDLGAAIVAGYAPGYGWGDGRTNLLCLQALLALFTEPLPSTIDIALTMDGQSIATGAVSRDRSRELVTLEVDEVAAAGTHAWEVSATPAVPGLGFHLSVTTWEPWPDPPPTQGVDLRVATPSEPKVGEAATLKVQAVAPAGPIEIRIELPAGVEPDVASLKALVGSTLTGYDVDGAKLAVRGNAEAGVAFEVGIRVIPTLAGTISSGPTILGIGSDTRTLPPSIWNIR